MFSFRESSVPNYDADSYLTVFGIYIITSTVFDYLDEIVAHNLRSSGGKFPFTPALERLAREEGLVGVVIQGTRFDIGTPAKFLETLQSFSGQQNRR